MTAKKESFITAKTAAEFRAQRFEKLRRYAESIRDLTCKYLPDYQPQQPVVSRAEKRKKAAKKIAAPKRWILGVD